MRCPREICNITDWLLWWIWHFLSHILLSLYFLTYHNSKGEFSGWTTPISSSPCSWSSELLSAGSCSPSSLSRFRLVLDPPAQVGQAVTFCCSGCSGAGGLPSSSLNVQAKPTEHYAACLGQNQNKIAIMYFNKNSCKCFVNWSESCNSEAFVQFKAKKKPR